MAAKNHDDEREPDEPQGDEPKVNDKRKIDPETGEVRPEAAAAEDQAPEAGDGLSEEDLALLADAEKDLVAEYREIAARAQADLKNFRTRVERDRAANREAVIAEVIRSLLPVIDDLDRADAHGDLVDGAPLTIVSQKLRAGFEKYGLRRVGEVGEKFDPNIHEAVVQVPEEDATGETVKDVLETGYVLGDRLIRAAKVAVSVPTPK